MIPEILQQFRERAAKQPRRIVYPEATDRRVLQAVARIVAMRMAKPVLVGSPASVEKKSKELGIDLSHVEIIDPGSAALTNRYAQLLLPDWRARGITEVEAKQRLENPMYFAAAMVCAGDAERLVGGAATTPGETVR